MTLAVNSITEALRSHAMNLGIFENVIAHEPKSAPGRGTSLAFWLDKITPSRSGLSSTSALLVYSARIYVPMLAEPQDGIDTTIGEAVDGLLRSLYSDMDLTTTVNYLDPLGINGVLLEATFGYINQDSILYRIAELTVPIVIENLWDQVM